MIDLNAASNIFKENLETGFDLGASLSIWKDGEEALGLSGGYADRQKSRPWDSSCRVLCWSATKGPSACTALLALHRHGIALESSVSTLWPEFAAAGKASVTFFHLLTHQAGLSAIDDLSLSPLDHSVVAAALASQAPAWEPGTQHGYHPRTFGYLLDEIVRRLENRTLGECWHDWIAAPAGIDFHIGIPAGEAAAVEEIFAPRSAKIPTKEAEFYKALTDPASLQSRSFASPGGMLRPSRMNAPEFRTACLPAFGGIGTAEGLARFYSILANGGIWQDIQLIPAEVCAQLQQPAVTGMDAVLGIPTAYSCGMMVPVPDGSSEHFPGIPGTHGHAGAGGALGFAVPALRVAFAYVPNQMELGILPTERTTRIVQALFAPCRASHTCTA